MSSDQPLKVISIFDPAIDFARMGQELHGQYANKRDFEIVRPYLIPGKVPTFYSLREVPRRLWFSSVMSEPTAALRCMRAFQCGVVSVENLYSRDGVYDPGAAQLARVGDGVIADEALDERFENGVIEEIGSVVYYRSFLGRRTERTYLLPPSCARAVDQIFLNLPAAASPSLPASSSETASSASASAPSMPPATEQVAAS
jgi:hypothetical protein